MQRSKTNFPRPLFVNYTYPFDLRWKKASHEQTGTDRRRNNIHLYCNNDIAWALRICNQLLSLNDSSLHDDRVFR